MTDLKNRSEVEIFQKIKYVERHIASISISNFKTSIPRINFKKIKLNKFQNLYGDFKSKNLTKIYLGEKLVDLNLPIRKTETEVVFEESGISPLRKKKSDDEKPPVIEVEENIQKSVTSKDSLVSENPLSDLNNLLEEDSEDIGFEENVIPQISVLKPKSMESKKDITFNLEAEIIQEDENILLSPTIPSTPQAENELISSSGKQAAFVWPPVQEKKTASKNKSKKTKKKPYFLSDESKSLNKLEEILEPVESKIADAGFPWALTQNDHPPIEEIFGGGLESELLDLQESPVNKQEVELKQEIKVSNIQTPDVQELKQTPFTGKVVYKALFPNVSFEPLPENIINDNLKNVNLFSRLLDKFNNLEFGIVVTGKSEKRTGKMFEKFGYKLTPIRIIILGGAVATLGYSVWNYLLPIINSSQVNTKVVVRDLFKAKKNNLNNKILTNTKEDKLQRSELIEGKSFSPITEDERLALIQMARESLENRLDPFGQEAVLPKEVIQQKIDEQKDMGPREIPINRVQLELVGVISANNKNLALVNVYNADYTITEEDDKSTRDSKLKTTLSMAVPNRLEVSLLDPVDEWYVKQIIKGKAKSDDPVIELVKGDKKFKLKVGQKVLLPEEKPPEELIEPGQDNMDTAKK